MTTPVGTERERTDDVVLPRPGVLLSRSVVYLALLALAVAAAWTAWAKVDVVVRARGQLVVEGEPVVLSPPEPGVAVELPVTVGAHVAQGDVLLRLRALQQGADAAGLASEREALRVEEARHVAAARAARARLPGLREESELARSSTRIVERQLEVFARLRAKGAASALQLEDKEQELADWRARILRLEAEMKQAREEAEDREAQAEEVRSRAAGIEARLAERQESQRDMSVVAPVGGTVVRLAVRHAGGWVGVDEPAVLLVPDGRPLRAVLQLPNAAMRRLAPGTAVRLRLDAFPPADYGRVEGKLLAIEPEPDAAGTFRAWATLDRATRPDRLDLGRLRPGFQLEAEVVVERKRVLDLVLRPLREAAERPLSVDQ